MTKTVAVTVYKLRWPGTNEVYVGSTVQELSTRLRLHRHKPCSCYSHLDINQATIVPVHTYRTSDRCNRQPEAAHKALLRKQNCKVLVDPNDHHRTPLWHTDNTKVKMSAAKKGAKNYRYAPFQVIFPDGRIDGWETTYEAGDAYGVSYRSICRYLTGESTPGNRMCSAHLQDTIWQYL